MMTTEERAKRIAHIENQISACAIRGTDLVPNSGDMTKLVALGRELFDITNGRNELLFDRKGRPNIVVNFPCDKTARLEWLSNSNEFFIAPSSWGSLTDGSSKRGVLSVHPAFLLEPLNRSNNTRGAVSVMAGFSLGKYQDVRMNNKNYHVSLRGFAPARESGGFSVSYSGLASEIDSINAGTVMPEAPVVGNISLAIFAYLALRSLKEGFQPRGNTQYGQSDKKTTEKGDNCGSIENGRVLHTKGGSGPLFWSHDGTPEGVYDLVGNVWEILHGYFLYGGELQFVPYNNAIDSTATLLAQGSSDFYAMNENGNFVAKGSSGTLKYDFKEDFSQTADTGSDVNKPYEVCKTITHTNRENTHMYGYVGNLNDITARESDLTNGIPTALKILTMGALDGRNPVGYHSARWYSETLVRIAVAGGSYNDGSSAGLFASYGSYWSAYSASGHGGARVAFARLNWNLGRIGV